MTQMPAEASNDGADWLRSITALTVELEGALLDDRLILGARQARRLAALARRFVGASSLGADCACDTQPCRLKHEYGGVAACRLALDLSRRAPATKALDLDPTVVAERYVAALRDAAPATYFCRRVVHAGGQCWFSVHGPADDLCGRVLAAGHGLSAFAQRRSR